MSKDCIVKPEIVFHADGARKVILHYTIGGETVQDKLTFRRARTRPATRNGQVVIKINADSYNKVVEVAEESGESLREVVSKMVNYAYDNVEYTCE